MIRISNLQIDSNSPELLPESLAREDCVLPLGSKDVKVRILLGRRPDYRGTIDQLELVLNQKLVCIIADYERVAKAVDDVYLLSSTEAMNCPIEFHAPCPKKWLELHPTQNDAVRFCDACHRNMIFCQSQNEAIEHAAAGQCVALYRLVETETVETLGLVEFTE